MARAILSFGAFSFEQKKGEQSMTIEEIQEALNKITGKDPISIARKRALLEMLYTIQNEQE